MPSLLATGAVHHHLIRENSRTRCGLVVETGEAREVAHFALLIGYGAGAVNPYLAFETMPTGGGSGMLYVFDTHSGQLKIVESLWYPSFFYAWAGEGALVVEKLGGLSAYVDVTQRSVNSVWLAQSATRPSGAISPGNKCYVYEGFCDAAQEEGICLRTLPPDPQQPAVCPALVADQPLPWRPQPWRQRGGGGILSQSPGHRTLGVKQPHKAVRPQVAAQPAVPVGQVGRAAGDHHAGGRAFRRLDQLPVELLEEMAHQLPGQHAYQHHKR